MSGLPLLSTRTGPNQDLYARALASIYRAGFRVHDPDYALSRDADPFDKIMKDPIVRSRIETRANRIATSTWEVQPGGPEDRDKLLAELMTKALEHINQFTSKRRIQTYGDIRGRSFQFIEGVRENTSLAGKRARWWLPRNLVDVDRRRFRWMVEHEGGDTTQMRVRPEFYSTRRDRWEKIDGQLHLFVKSIMDDQEMRLNYGRGLMESAYFYLWMKGEVLTNGLQGVETWAQGKTVAKIAGLRDAATGRPNETAQQAWLDVLEIFKSRHYAAFDKEDEVTTEWPSGTGQSMVMEFLHYLDDGVTALFLGAVLPFGGGGDVGSLARSETEKSVHEEIMQGRRDAFDEDYTRDLVGLTMRMNRQNIRALGLQDAERPVFKSIVPKVKNTKENVQLIAVARQSVPLPKDWVYEQIDAPQPTQEDFDNDNVFLPEPQGGAGGGLPGGLDIGRDIGGTGGQQPAQPGEADPAAQIDTNAEGDPVGTGDVPIAAEGVEPPNMQEVSLALERAIKNADRKTASITRRQLWSIMGAGDAPEIDDAEWEEMQGAGSNGGGMPGEPPGEPEPEVGPADAKLAARDFDESKVKRDKGEFSETQGQPGQGEQPAEKAVPAGDDAPTGDAAPADGAAPADDAPSEAAIEIVNDDPDAWKEAGFATVGEAAAWADEGFEDPDDAFGYADEGFTPAEATEWAEAEVDGPDAGAWKAAGVEPDGVEDWGDIEAEEAKAWTKAGFEGADANEWSDQGMEAADAAKWVKAGFDDAEDAENWQANDFEPKDAAKWNQGQLEGDPDTAGEWRDREVKPKDAQAFEENFGSTGEFDTVAEVFGDAQKAIKASKCALGKGTAFQLTADTFALFSDLRIKLCACRDAKLRSGFDESKVKRDKGEFAEKPGVQPNEKTPSDQDADGIPDAEEPDKLPDDEASKNKRLAKAKAVGKAILKIVNAGPTIVSGIAKEAGASAGVAKAAMVLATIGDFSVPGIPVGSIAVGIVAQVIGIRKVNALRIAVSTIKQTIADLRGKKEEKPDA